MSFLLLSPATFLIISYFKDYIHTDFEVIIYKTILYCFLGLLKYTVECFYTIVALLNYLFYFKKNGTWCSYITLSAWLWVADTDPYLATKISRNNWETTMASDIMTPQLRVTPFTYFYLFVCSFVYLYYLYILCPWLFSTLGEASKNLKFVPGLSLALSFFIFSYNHLVNSSGSTTSILCPGSRSAPGESKWEHQNRLPYFLQLHHEDSFQWWLFLPDVIGTGLSGPQLRCLELQRKAFIAQPHKHFGAAWPKGRAASSVEVPAEGKLCEKENSFKGIQQCDSSIWKKLLVDCAGFM